MEQDQNAKGSFLSRLENNEFDRFGVISVGFLLIGIVGGMTVGISAYAHIWQIAVIVAFTMFSLSMMLAVAPMKIIVRSVIAAMLVDVLILLLNIFM